MNGMPTISLPPYSGFTFSELPNLFFRSDPNLPVPAPAQAGPEWSSATLYGDAATYSGAAAAVHIGGIWGIPDLPLVPGVWTVSDFFRGWFIDVLRGGIALRGLDVLAIMLYEYRQAGGYVLGIQTPDTLGYEFEIIVKASAQAELMGADVWGKRWSPESVVGSAGSPFASDVWGANWRPEASSCDSCAQPDVTSGGFSINDIVGAVVGAMGLIIAGLAPEIAIPALVFTGIAALALSPGLRSSFANLFSEVTTTATGSVKDVLGGSVGTVLTMPIVVTGVVVAGIVGALYYGEAKTGRKLDTGNARNVTAMFSEVGDAATRIPLNQVQVIKAVKDVAPRISLPHSPPPRPRKSK